MNFNFLFKWITSSAWQRKLTEVMAKLAVEYNSYYQRTYSFSELLLRKPMQLLVSTQFVEGRVRFKQGTSLPVLVWEVELGTLQKMGFQYAEVFTSRFLPKNKTVRIPIPAPLSEHFEDIITTLTAYTKYSGHTRAIRTFRDTAIITSSGRSFWIGWQDQTKLHSPFCFKLDTLDVLTARDYINYRRLSPDDAKLAILVNDLLEETILKKAALRNFFNESLAVHIQSQQTDSTHRYVCLERHIDFKKSDIMKGDFLVGVQVLLSPDFWQTKRNLSVLEITSKDLKSFFKDQLIGGFAELIKNSIENTFLHFEIHQQNLTCHLRKGKLQKLIVHDLQDVIFDPVSFLISHDSSQWSEKLKQISRLYKVRFFNFYGEQRLNITKHSHFFVPASFYRRYFRNFGNYTRLYNQAAEEDYLLSRKLESLVVQQLNYSDEELGLTGSEGAKLKASPGFIFLREHLFWVIARRIRVNQLNILNAAFAKLSEAQVLTDNEQKNLLLRAQREVCFFSANLPERMSLSQCQFERMYRIFEDKIYFLRLKNGQMAALIFIQTLGIDNLI